MSQRKRRQRRKAAARSEPATGTNGTPAAKVSGRKRRAWPVFRVRLTWRDATQSARWLNRTAVVWGLSAVALVAVFFWQRMFPVAGVWVSTADLQAVEPVVGSGIDAARMTFMWQLVAAQFVLFGVAPVSLSVAIRHASRQLPLEDQLATRGVEPLAYAVLWIAFLLLAAAWFVPFGTHADGWVAALPLLLGGQEVALPVDGHVLWLLGATIAVVAYQLMVLQWIDRLWNRRRSNSRADADSHSGVVLASLVVVAMVVPILFACLLYWAMAHWFATGGPHYVA